MPYCGHVFDRENNPISRIRISDGKNVCLTDETGFFSLAGWEKASLIFCCVLTKSHDDWYLPIEAGRDCYDFHLSLADEAGDHRFLHIGDTEIANRDCESFVPFLKETAREQNAAFLMHGGDIAGEEAMVRHREGMCFETVGCPVRYCIGNHDFLDGPYGEKRYEELYGPVWYSFDVGEIRYAVLSIPKGSGGFLSGYSLEEQYRFLENDLHAKAPKALVIFRHDRCAEGDRFVVPLAEKTLDLKKLGLIAWIHGHDHSCYTNLVEGSLLMGSAVPDSGGIDNTPASVRCTSVKGDALSTEILYRTHPHDEPAEAIWTVSLPGTIEYASLLELDDSLICATCDDGYPKTCGVYRLDKECGKILWFYQTKNSIKNKMAMDEDSVYCQDSEGNVYAIRLKDGTLRWQMQILFPADPEQADSPLLSFNHCKNGVVLNEGLLYVGNGRAPLCLYAADGSVCFRGDVCKKGNSAPADTILSPDGSIVYYHAQWFRLLALDAASGKTLWDHRSQKKVIGNPGAFWFRTNTPLYHNGKLYVFGFSRGAIADAKTGEILLHKPISVKTEVVGAPIFHGDLIYLPTSKQGVVAMDPETLDVKFSYPVGEAQVLTSSYVVGRAMTVEASPLIRDGSLIIAANDGYVYFYDLDAPVLQRKIKLAFATLTTPIVKENHLFAASFDGTVGKYAL